MPELGADECEEDTMTQPPVADLDDALEQVIAAARAHLTAVRTAGGAVDDASVWRSYVTLNNASFAYDQLLLDRFGEVTPWETEEIDLRVTGEGGQVGYLTGDQATERAEDPYPAVVSVRQRRDYRVPSVAALLAVAGAAARREAGESGEEPPPETVADAVLELVRDGDGSLSNLDVPELEPLAGVVTVTDLPEPVDLEIEESERLFQSGPDGIAGRLDEAPFFFDDDDDDDDDEVEDLEDLEDLVDVDDSPGGDSPVEGGGGDRDRP